VDNATFRLGEQNAFAWSKAWQGGSLSQALPMLAMALEDDPSGAPLLLLGQARREVDRLCRLAEARRQGAKKREELVSAVGLGPNQAFLFDGYDRVLGKIGPDGAARLLRLVNQTDLDLKGVALSRSVSPLLNLTTALTRAWF
jgi:DNA polymerase III delta subunit